MSMTAQAGAVAWLYQYIEDGIAQADLTLIRFLPSWVEAKQAQETPLYALPPAAVPVEALEGLVAELRNEAGDWTSGDVRAAYNRISDRIERLIKERSNG